MKAFFEFVAILLAFWLMVAVVFGVPLLILSSAVALPVWWFFL